MGLLHTSNANTTAGRTHVTVKTSADQGAAWQTARSHTVRLDLVLTTAEKPFPFYPKCMYRSEFGV